MDSALINAAAQIPIVFIFVWFILKWTDKINEQMKARDKNFLQALSEERKHRMDMMSQERDLRAALAERLSEGLNAIDANVLRSLDQLQTILVLISEHDARTEYYINGAKE